MTKITIPFYGLKRFYTNNKSEILNKIDSAFSNGQFLKGNENKAFERNLANYCNRKFAVTVSSCTDALFFALKVLGIAKGDEIIVTSFSFISSATAIIRAGAIPVFIDINPDTFLMNLSELEKAISKKTKAIIAVQLFGQTLDFDKLEKIAKSHNLFIIEDAAQSLGSKNNNKKSGNFGEISCLSFDPTKIIGAFGTGGAIVTNNKSIYNELKLLTGTGKVNSNFNEIGYNSQINTAQANLLDWQLKNIENNINIRNKIAERYSQKLKQIKQIQTPIIQNGNTHIFHKYVVKAEKRNQLKEYLLKNGIETMIHYNNALFDNTVFHNNCIINDMENVKTITKKVLSLPIYPELQLSEINYICEILKSFYNI